MNIGGRKDAKPQSPPRKVSSASEEELLTSEDLFGDLVDAPLPPKPEPDKPAQKGPIRVQVSEPGVTAKPEAKPVKKMAQVLPEDVAALLNAFEAPSAPAAGPASSPPAPDEPAQSEELLEALGPLDELMQAPKTTASEPRAEPLTRLTELEKLARGGKPAKGAAPRFQAAPPDKGPVEERVLLDLAALAEDAFARALHKQAPRDQPVRGQRDYGPYRLLEKVAVGGMAEVFKAKRSGVEGFEKVVAVKRILSHLSDNKEFVDMFIDEAKMVAGLTHPNIVQIHDLGRIEKSYYIAMEYVHGRDLRSIMKRAKERGIRIPLDLSALIVSEVCAALGYAHRKKDESGRPMRIVHRDISPQNILISFEGEVKITDFGIAKAASKASSTDRGALRGKLLYMSPEQAWGKSIDRRSDIFSVGIVFYEMITEEKPFLASSEISILEMVRECRVTPPRSLNPRIPERLEAVALKALAKEPDQRYQDAGEMAKDLERALSERKAPSSAELAKFMAVLFDRSERGDAVADEHPSGEHRPGGSGSIEVELEATPSTPSGGSKTKPSGQDMSIDKLLKRFGIK